MSVPLAICSVFIFCSSNVFILELMVKEYPPCGYIVTCAQFIFISLVTLPAVLQNNILRPKIPFTCYAQLVALHFIGTVSNNLSLAYHISMPLHMILRSGSLLASIIFSKLILKRSYSYTKYFSVFIVTIGIILATLASSSEKKVAKSEGSFIEWLFGLFLLSLTLITGATLGIIQEKFYKIHGKHHNESLFYNHALPLPAFFLFSSGLTDSIAAFSNSPYFFSLPIPRLWLYLFVSVITQYLCIRSVFILIADCSSLTVNLVLTQRKFMSLIFSVIYFNNNFTATHWLAAFLIFIGSLLFSDVHLQLFRLKKE